MNMRWTPPQRMLETFTLDLFHVPFTPFDATPSWMLLRISKSPRFQFPSVLCMVILTHASLPSCFPRPFHSCHPHLLLLPSWFPQQLPAHGACAESAVQTPRSMVWRGELRRKYPETGQCLTQGNGVLVCHFRHRIRETLQLEET